MIFVPHFLIYSSANFRLSCNRWYLYHSIRILKEKQDLETTVTYVNCFIVYIKGTCVGVGGWEYKSIVHFKLGNVSEKD